MIALKIIYDYNEPKILIANKTANIAENIVFVRMFWSSNTIQFTKKV